MRYHSYQNLLTKIFFPKSGLSEQLYTKFKAAHAGIYLNFSQKQKTTKFMGYYSCPKSGLPVYIIYYGICQTKPVLDLGLLNGYLHNFLSKTNEIIV